MALDPRSLRALIRRLVVHARAMGATIEEAEDLTQDALEMITRNPEWHDTTRGTLETALRVVVRSRHLNAIRHVKVQQRAAPKLQLVDPPRSPEGQIQQLGAQVWRRRLLSLLEPGERRVFRAWVRQRNGTWNAPEAAASLELTPAAYEAAKKRLRRRVRGLLVSLDIDPQDLFDTPTAPLEGHHEA